MGRDSAHTPAWQAKVQGLEAEVQRLRTELAEAHETLRAIRTGEVDAIVVAGEQGEQVFSLSGAESVYRLIVQTMQEAALTVTPDGTILSCNPQFETFIHFRSGWVIGRPLEAFVVPEERPQLAALLAQSQTEPVQQRLVFRTTNGVPVPAHVAAHTIQQPDGPCVCLIAADLTALESSLATLQQIREQEAALRNSERLYRAIGETIDYGIWICAPDGRNIYASESFLQLVGLTQQECADFGWGRVLHPDDAEQTFRAWQECVRTGGTWDIEHRVRGADGQWHPILARGVPVKDERGQITCWAGINLDISRLKGVQAVLQESEQRFRTLLEEAPIAISVSRGGVILYANQKYADVFGYPREALRERSLLELWAAESGTDAAGRVGQPGLGALLPSDHEAIGRRQDGAHFPAQVFGTLVDLADGPAAVAFVTDITARKQAEEAQRASEEQARSRLAEIDAIYDAAPVGLCVVDRELRYRRINRRMAEINGMPAVAHLGRTVREIVPDLAPLAEELAARIVRTGEPVFDIEFSGTTAAQPWAKRSWIEHWLPLTNPAGELIGINVVAEEVTQRKQAEAELRRSKEDLERLAQTLEGAVQERTGELRAAVATLQQQQEQLQVLTNELAVAEERERQRLAEVLHDGLQRILVACRLRVALLERSKNRAEWEAGGDLAPLLEQALATSRSLTAELSPPVLREAGLVPALEWLGRWMAETHHLPVAVQADGVIPLEEPTRIFLFRSVRELLFNTVKHARALHARVEVGVRDGAVYLCVADDGVGFDPAKIQPVGIGGLGLASIRQRLAFLGGTLAIDSAPGQGSRFTLRVPLLTAAQAVGTPSSADPARKSPAPLRILVADDHQVVRQALTRLFDAEPDLEVVAQAADGEEAVTLAGTERPDVIVMDVQMPTMDGVEATRRIRAAFPQIQVVGLSMFTSPEQAQAMQDAGAAACVSKGGPAPALLTTIRTCAGPGTG